MIKTTLLFSLVLLINANHIVLASDEQDYTKCGLHPKAIELAKLIINDEEQKRVKLTCNPLLAEIAADKAKEMADLGVVDHFGSKISANARLREAGYPLRLVDDLGLKNQSEAVQGGFEYADDAWFEFKTSYGHRIHLLGEHSFFLEQDEIGVGYYRKWESPHVDYWAVYVAKKEQKSQH
ncbi:MAG: CAP domain-containing protein [Kangiellaceae bacterium]|nr:CAP domain-containing protein [Kangiellaceae bacterium]